MRHSEHSGIRKNSADEAFKGEKFNSNMGKEIFVFTKEMTLLGWKRTGGLLQKTEMGEINNFKWCDNKNKNI